MILNNEPSLKSPLQRLQCRGNCKITCFPVKGLSAYFQSCCCLQASLLIQQVPGTGYNPPQRSGEPEYIHLWPSPYNSLPSHQYLPGRSLDTCLAPQLLQQSHNGQTPRLLGCNIQLGLHSWAQTTVANKQFSVVAGAPPSSCTSKHRCSKNSYHPVKMYVGQEHIRSSVIQS